MKNNTFCNGSTIAEENLIHMIKECSENSWKNSDLDTETEVILEKIAFTDYEGKQEDIDYILEKLQEQNNIGFFYPDASLLTVENIIKKGEWYFQNVNR